MKKRSVVGGCAGLLVLSLILGSLAILNLTRVTEELAESDVMRDSAARTVLERFPDTEANSTAQSLEALTSSMGFSVLMDTDADSDAGTQVDENIKALRQSTGERVQSLRTEERRTDRPLPPDITNFLSTHRSTLVEARRLLAQESPVWPQRLSASLNDWGPDIIGIFFLSRLLLLEALEASQAGLTSEADEAIDALWNLEQSFEDRPTFLDQIFYRRHLDYLQVYFRQTGRMAPSQRAFLRTLDLPEKYLQSLPVESWSLLRAIQNDPFADRSPWPFRTKIFRTLQAVPYIRTQRAARTGLEPKMARGFDYDSYMAENRWDAPWPHNERMVDQLASHHSYEWVTVHRSQLALELTLRILDLRRTLCEAGSLEAQTLQTAAVPDLAWRVRPGTPNVIELSEDFLVVREPWEENFQRRHYLALRFEISLDDCGRPPYSKLDPHSDSGFSVSSR